MKNNQIAFKSVVYAALKEVCDPNKDFYPALIASKEYKKIVEFSKDYLEKLRFVEE